MWLTASLRSEEHTSELQSLRHLVCRLLLEKKNRAPPRRTMRPLPPCWPLGTTPVRLSHAALHREAIVAERSAPCAWPMWGIVFFFKDRGPPEIYPLSLPDALPI